MLASLCVSIHLDAYYSSPWLLPATQEILEIVFCRNMPTPIYSVVTVRHYGYYLTLWRSMQLV